MAIWTLRLNVPGDDEEASRMASNLIAELRETDADSVSRKKVSANSAPEGAKGVGADDITTIVIAASNAAMISVASVLRAWYRWRQGRSFHLSNGTITLDLSGLTPDEAEKAIDAFVQANNDSTP